MYLTRPCVYDSRSPVAEWGLWDQSPSASCWCCLAVYLLWKLDTWILPRGRSQHPSQTQTTCCLGGSILDLLPKIFILRIFGRFLWDKLAIKISPTKIFSSCHLKWTSSKLSRNKTKTLDMPLIIMKLERNVYQKLHHVCIQDQFGLRNGQKPNFLVLKYHISVCIFIYLCNLCIHNIYHWK